MEPVTFIDREPELRLIEDAFADLLNKERLLRTPIIDFYGIDGIGKTRILREVIQKCEKNQVPYIESNMRRGLLVLNLLQRVSSLARKHKQQLPLEYDDKDPLQQFIESTSTLLEQGPLVMLLDAVDSTNEQHVADLENILSKLVPHNNLFVVLTSRSDVAFEHEKTVARKLTTRSIQPFDRTHSELYLDNIGHPLTSEVRELIFAWTRGYPLAMQVMVDGIVEKGILPTTEQGQKELITLIVEKVINQRILSDITKDELEWFQTALRLLAVPRRFNLVIMQDLIEHFEPEMKLASSLAYIALPRRITRGTGALSWDMAKAGFALDDSVRNILLLHLKITDPQRYYKINHFLAEINWTSATSEEVAGPDRIRYQREYLYHSANSVDKQRMPQILEETVKKIIENAANAPDQLIQFHEEFLMDKELREALGEYGAIVVQLINVSLAQQMYNFASQEQDENKRIRYLQVFFTYIIHGTRVIELPAELQENMRQLLAKEKPAVILKLYEELPQDEKIKGVLRRDFPILFTHLDDIDAEG